MTGGKSPLGPRVLSEAAQRRIEAARDRAENRRNARELSAAQNRVVGPFRTGRTHAFVELDLEVEIPWEATRTYRYSKLYYSRGPSAQFDEARVVCFRIEHNRRRHRVCLELPERARGSGLLHLRFDPFPYASGRARLHKCRLLRASQLDPALGRAARLDALKQHTRAAVVASEQSQVEVVDHYPESLALEVQPRCNLTCGHCSSHGTAELHARHNRLEPIEAARLQALADELFPHLTLLNIVGRGEPLMVNDALWSQLIGEARRYRLLLSVVTNGYFIERRITPEVLPLLDTLTVSLDGFSPDAFAANRGGGSFERVVAGVRHFHRLRREACLPRRPKLCVSWTLKKNNIRELPDFVRFMRQFEPDRYFMRHLLIFHEKDAAESLLDSPRLANHYLSETYGLFEEMGIETDCPPLVNEVMDALASAPARDSGRPADAGVESDEQDRICTCIHRTGILLAGGEMSTCSVQYAAKVGTFGNGTDFASLWNGEVMRGVRRDINTSKEWDQCRDCWYRQSRYQAQRAEQSRGSSYPLTRPARFSRQAWDFRGYEGPPAV